MEAEELSLQVLNARTRMSGIEHPQTLTWVGNLTAIYQRQGRWKEAETLNLHVSKTREKVLGPEHPDG